MVITFPVEEVEPVRAMEDRMATIAVATAPVDVRRQHRPVQMVVVTVQHRPVGRMVPITEPTRIVAGNVAVDILAPELESM